MKKILLALALAFSFSVTFLQSSESTKPVVTQEPVFTISCNFPNYQWDWEYTRKIYITRSYNHINYYPLKHNNFKETNIQIVKLDLKSII